MNPSRSHTRLHVGAQGPTLRKDPTPQLMLGFMLGCHPQENFNTFWTKSWSWLYSPSEERWDSNPALCDPTGLFTNLGAMLTLNPKWLDWVMTSCRCHQAQLYSDIYLWGKNRTVLKGWNLGDLNKRCKTQNKNSFKLWGPRDHKGKR